MTAVGMRFDAKYDARLVVTVVFPDPPFVLITSVVFGLTATPLPNLRLNPKAKPPGRGANYFTPGLL
jgi:hypothetical protein